MPTQCNTNFFRSNLWVGIIVISAVIAISLVRDPCSLHTTSYGKRKVQQGAFISNSSVVVKPEQTEIYKQIEFLNLEESISHLNSLSKHAQKIIPHFPSFPKIWLLPPANKDHYGSRAERYCIEFMELLFPGYHFRKIRPDWLRNPETGRPLELDGYCEELSLAIEYNGIQHYVWPNFLPMTREQFYKQRDRDQIKAEICIERNICLIRIPHTVLFERLPLAIYAKLLDAVPGLKY